jgi:hypothetical protein
MVIRLVIPDIRYAGRTLDAWLAGDSARVSGRALSCDGSSAVADAKTPQETGDVLLGRGGPYADPSGDLLVGGTVRDEVDDLLLPRRQLGRGGFGPRLAAPKPGAERLATVRELAARDTEERATQPAYGDRGVEVAIRTGLKGDPCSRRVGAFGNDDGRNEVRKLGEDAIVGVPLIEDHQGVRPASKEGATSIGVRDVRFGQGRTHSLFEIRRSVDNENRQGVPLSKRMHPRGLTTRAHKHWGRSIVYLLISTE